MAADGTVMQWARASAATVFTLICKILLSTPGGEPTKIVANVITFEI